MIILGFYYEIYCSTAILITDFSSLLLHLEQSYGSTGIVVISFPSDTPEFWRERGSNISGDQHCYSPSWFLLWKIISFPSLLPFTPQHQAWGANGESASTFASSIGKFRGKARTNLMWRVARCGSWQEAGQKWCSAWMRAENTQTVGRKDYGEGRSESRFNLFVWKV